jgi:hydroxyethylthiazole kinase
MQSAAATVLRCAQDVMANVLLAGGMSPAMAHSLDEVEQFVGIAAALLVNMGTLESSWVASKKLSAKQVIRWGAVGVRHAARLCCVGTLRRAPHRTRHAAPTTHRQAVALGKPWVLDPVGCGATTYRTQACVAMLQLQPTVVRGNASEILALAGAAGAMATVPLCRYAIVCRYATMLRERVWVLSAARREHSATAAAGIVL